MSDKQLLESAKLKYGKWKLVAEALGVSNAYISRLVHGKETMGQELRDKLEALQPPYIEYPPMNTLGIPNSRIKWIVK